jgi:hypothetical protein
MFRGILVILVKIGQNGEYSSLCEGLCVISRDSLALSRQIYTAVKLIKKKVVEKNEAPPPF